MDKCIQREVKGENEEIYKIEDCSTSTTLLEEDYNISYRTLNGIIYKISFKLKTNKNELSRFSYSIAKYFVERNDFNITERSKKINEDFSKYTNSLIERIIQDYGKFNNTSKIQSKTNDVEMCLLPEVKQYHNEIIAIMRKNHNRSARFEILKSSAAKIDGDPGANFLWTCLPIVEMCSVSCLVDMYTFEWIKDDSSMTLKIHMPENKNSYFFNYDINIIIENKTLNRNIDNLIIKDDEKKLKEKIRLKEEEDRNEEIKRKELWDYINMKKKMELDNKKKDF
jgi:hypothetical protein